MPKGRPGKRINVSFDEELLQKIDDYAQSHYMSRSAFLTYAASQVLLADKVQRSLDELNSVLQKVYKRAAATPDFSISEKDVKELEHMEFMLNLISGEYAENKAMTNNVSEIQVSSDDTEE